MNEQEYTEKTTSRMFIKKEDLKQLMMLFDFYRWDRHVDIGVAEIVGHWITPYALIQVCLLKDKCDTCANYKPKNVIGSVEL